MEDRKSLIFLICLLFVFPSFSFAYKPHTTHRGLTHDILNFYERLNPGVLTEEDRMSVEKGAVDEDSGVRALNHFYDPIYDKGILPTSLTSKRWATDTLTQANSSVAYSAMLGNVANAYFGSETDYSWERAIYEYVHGNKGRGLESFGHVLHLLEDAAVPDHTRDDAHPDFFWRDIFSQESPYENFTNIFNSENIKISETLIRDGVKPIVLDSLGEYFDALAIYSNTNFFSKSTIFVRRYSAPTISYERAVRLSDGKFYIFGFNRIGSESYKLVRVKKTYNSADDVTSLSYYISDRDNSILTDYWNLLSRQAVVHGAGVIELFFKEVEKEKQTLALYNKNKSLLGRALEGVANAVAFSGRGVKDSTENLASVVSALESAQVVAEDAPVELPVEPNLVSDEDVSVQTEPQLTEGDSTPDTPQDDTVSVDLPAQETEPPPVDSVVVEPAPNPGTPYPGFGGGGTVAVSSDTTAPAAPVITAPADFSSTSTTATISFSGTAESGSTVSIAYASGGATTTSSATATGGVWSFPNVSLSQGVNAVSFTAADSAGNTSSATWATLTIDSSAPSFSSFSVTECADSLAVSGCLTTATTLNLSWSSADGDIVEYRITKDYATISTLTATSGTATVSNGTYSFAVVAVDSAGNRATSTAQSVEVAGLPVVLNEIAWSGTSASTSDEWIELYNPTAKSVNLSGWTIYAGDGTPYVPLSGTIAAGGYYLIERDDDTAVSNVSANLISAFSDLENSGEDMYLARFSNGATTTIDSRTAACGLSWCGGTSATRYSMERYGNNQSELAVNDWGSALGEFILNGTDANGNIVKGTPGRKNSLSYQLTKTNTLTADKTVLAVHSPYLVGREGFTVNAGTTLTVEPGVVIKVVDANAPSVTVNGALVTNGTSESPVIFTAFSDDTYGGDMNGDGSATTPAAGGWKQIMFTSSGSGSSLTNTVIRYGGKWFDGQTYKTMIAAVGTSITLNGVTAEYSLKHGLLLSNSTSTITNSTFRYSNSDSSSYAITIGGASPTISNTTIANNSYGISVSSATTTLSNMTFSGNTYFDITGSNNPVVTCTNCGTPTTSPANLIQ